MKNKIRKLVAAIAAAGTLVAGMGGCSVLEVLGGDNTTSIGDTTVSTNVNEPYIISIVPQQITLNDRMYELDIEQSQNADYSIAHLIGYLVNRSDYETYFHQVPDLLYAIDENDGVVYPNGNKVPVYSLNGYAVEDRIGIGATTTTIYVNNNRDGN